MGRLGKVPAELARSHGGLGSVGKDAASGFPIGADKYGVCLGSSLFTCLDPDDTRATPSHRRKAVDVGGRAVFTVFLDEPSASGHSCVDRYSEAIGASFAGLAAGTYVDAFPDDPPKVALYDRAFLSAMPESVEWGIEQVLDTTEYSQHTSVARSVGKEAA